MGKKTKPTTSQEGNKKKAIKTNFAGKILVQNRKAFHDYEFIDSLEAGIVLMGTEIKALRLGRGNLKDSFAICSKGEVLLLNMYIGDYPNAHVFKHDNTRKRKLLLHKKEINKLIGLIKKDGISLIATSVFLNDKNIAKVKLSLAKGRKKADKRAAEKEKDWNRDKHRILKGNNNE